MARLTHADLLDAASLPDPSRDLNGAIRGYQQALTHGKNALAEYHLEGGSSAVLARNLSWLTDQILLHAWRSLGSDQGITDAIDLIAAGGYGRAELNLESDIDLLILVGQADGAEDPMVTDFAERFIRFCWDIGIKVGHSLRSEKECVAIARSDISVITNLMETRLLSGNRQRFESLQEKLRSRRVWPVNRFFREKREEQASRHRQFGDTAYNLEPNIKQSKGGLRDLHMISWVANRYFGTSDLAELVEHGFLTDTEYRALIRHRDFLWRLRNGLHYLSGRCEDRLLFDYQQRLAEQLGYQGGENHLAVERMMRDYYRTAKEMQLLNELLLQHFEEAILRSGKRRARPINERFQSVGSVIESVHDGVFRDQPRAMLEIFLLLLKRKGLTGIRASTVRQIRANLDLINGSFRRNPEHRAVFLEMFRHQAGLSQVLRRMSAYGVLGRFFPDFGNIVGQMQHDLFHVYTVDAHSMFVVGNLQRLAEEDHRQEFPHLTNLLSQQNGRERLYLAALCHDLGKGSGRDHSEAGEEIALRLCNNLGMSEYDAGFVGWLVRHHLVMSWTAQKEDITDPRVIDRFAETVGDQEHLDNLYLLTFADIRGTSPKVWSEWKGRLLYNLYMATSRRLRTGLSGAQAVAERIEARKKAIRKLVSRRVGKDSLDRLWAQLGEEYFLRNGPGSSAWHAEVITAASAIDLPLVTGRPRKDLGALQILVLAPESEELLPRLTGGLDRLHLNILDARIHPIRSGLSLLVFVASDPENASGNRKWLIETMNELRDNLLKPIDGYRPARRILPRVLKQFSVEARISFHNDTAREHTVMEVVANDRPGLLYNVALALHECKVKLISAKVSTVGELAEDTFFIADRDGKPVNAGDQRECLSSRLRKYLG
jgi:[protein-PII] uridylyltransferase